MMCPYFMQVWASFIGANRGFLFVCLFLFFVFIETGFLSSFGAGPGTHLVDQAGLNQAALELTKIYPPLPPECGVLGVKVCATTAQLPIMFLFADLELAI